MKPRHILAISLAGALLGLAQSQTLKNDRDPFTITIEASTEKAVAGMQIDLKISVLNTSAGTMVARSGFQAYDGDPTYEYSCHDWSGNSVSKEIPMIGSVHDAPLIKPGEIYTSTVLLNRVCDVSRPGRYEIQLSRGVPMGSNRHLVKSNKIAITVVP
jgi:hypothetical protein